MEIVDVDGTDDLESLIDEQVEPGVGLLVVIVTGGDVPADWVDDAAAIAVMADGPFDPRVRLVTVSGVPEGSYHRPPSDTLLDPRMQPGSTACVAPDGTSLEPSRQAVRLAEAIRELYVGSRTISLCAEDWPHLLVEEVVDGAGSGGSCIHILDARSGYESPPCHVYEIYEDPVDCGAFPGREAAPTDAHPHRCRVRHVEPSGDGPPEEPGWWLYRSRWCGTQPELRYAGDVTLPEHGVRGQLECLVAAGECRGL